MAAMLLTLTVNFFCKHLRDYASKVMQLRPSETVVIVQQAAREIAMAIQRGNALMVLAAGKLSLRELQG